MKSNQSSILTMLKSLIYCGCIFLLWLIIFVYSGENQADANIDKLVSQTINNNENKVFPVDEAAKNPDFLQFRQELLIALEQKNLGFLVKHIDDNIKVSFGGYHGIEDFIKYWELDQQPQQSKIWKTLKDTLELGGKFEENNLNSFIAPYTFLSRKITDSYSQLIITGTDVRIRKKPSLQGEIIGSLSYDIVTSMFEDNLPSTTINGETYLWVKIKTQTGIEGYVYGKYVRSPIDYRANFQKRGDSWKMIFFVAGD